jgi:uncharacterized Fe-S cluster-containing radical SAM superfamily protein
MATDPIERAFELRKTLVQDGKVLVADFSDTLQGKDTSRVIDLMPIKGTDKYPFRAKVNVKYIDPYAAKEYGLPFFDVRKNDDNAIEKTIRESEFDFPLWFKHNQGFKMKDAMSYNAPFILQVAGCNFHDGTSSGGCWYCFVDDESNDGRLSPKKVYLGIEETLDSMQEAREKIKSRYAEIGFENDMKVLRTSGGEPTLALDWILNLWREMKRRGLDVVGQLDSNLSTASVVDNFEKEGVYEKNTLKKLAEYPIKVLTALKGVDEPNLQSNVQSMTTLSEQERSLRKFVESGFDIYPQMYNPNPNTLGNYLSRIDSIIENFSLRIHIGPLKLYGPNSLRLNLEARRRKINPDAYIQLKREEWTSNYERGCEVLDSYLKVRYSVGYKETTRSDVRLKLRN